MGGQGEEGVGGQGEERGRASGVILLHSGVLLPRGVYTCVRARVRGCAGARVRAAGTRRKHTSTLTCRAAASSERERVEELWVVNLCRTFIPTPCSALKEHA